MRDLITSTGRVARRGETKTGFSISVNDHETIAALAKAIAGEIVTHWAASTNPPVRVVYEPLADVVEIGSLVIDTKGYDVTDDGVPVTLKPREYALLLALARGAGHAFTREKLLELSHPIRKRISAARNNILIHSLAKRIRMRLAGVRTRRMTGLISVSASFQHPYGKQAARSTTPIRRILAPSIRRTIAR